jgi:hypothetical protein
VGVLVFRLECLIEPRDESILGHSKLQPVAAYICARVVAPDNNNGLRQTRESCKALSGSKGRDGIGRQCLFLRSEIGLKGEVRF